MTSIYIHIKYRMNNVLIPGNDKLQTIINIPTHLEKQWAEDAIVRERTTINDFIGTEPDSPVGLILPVFFSEKPELNIEDCLASFGTVPAPTQLPIKFLRNFLTLSQEEGICIEKYDITLHKGNHFDEEYQLTKDKEIVGGVDASLYNEKFLDQEWLKEYLEDGDDPGVSDSPYDEYTRKFISSRITSGIISIINGGVISAIVNSSGSDELKKITYMVGINAMEKLSAIGEFVERLNSISNKYILKILVGTEGRSYDYIYDYIYRNFSMFDIEDIDFIMNNEGVILNVLIPTNTSEELKRYINLVTDEFADVPEVVKFIRDHHVEESINEELADMRRIAV